MDSKSPQDVTPNSSLNRQSSPVRQTAPICHKMHPLQPTLAAKSLYQSWLQGARERRDSTAIPNELPWHSKMAVSELLLDAIDKQKAGQQVVVRLLTGTMTPNVYTPEWQQLVSRFLESGGDFRVIVWNDSFPTEGDTFWAGDKCALLENKAFEVRVTHTRQKGESLSHFLTVGDRAFRLEAPHRYFGSDTFSEVSPEIPAQICFNDAETAKPLCEFFDKIWNILGTHKVAVAAAH